MQRISQSYCKNKTCTFFIDHSPVFGPSYIYSDKNQLIVDTARATKDTLKEIRENWKRNVDSNFKVQLEEDGSSSTKQSKMR